MDPEKMPSEVPVIDPASLRKSSHLLFPILLIVLGFFILLCIGLYITSRKNLNSGSNIKTSPTITQIPSPTQTLLPSIPDDWKFYKNEKLYFSLRYPNGWFITEDSMGKGTQQNSLGGIMLSNVPSDKYTPASENKAFWIYLTKVDKEWTLEEWKKQFMADNGELKSQQDMIIDGVPAIKFTVKYSGEEPFQLIYIILKKETLGWSIMFIPSATQSSTQELDQIISTFKLLSTASYVEPIEMMGASMEPTLKNGQRYSVDRKAYLTAKPNRGDIVLIERPDKPYTQVIKRIIGLPGESIMIKDGKVYLNEVIVDEPYLFTPDSTLPNYPGFIDEGEKLTIGQDQYFVMGDSRNRSSDSREWGYVAVQNIKGKLNSL